MVFYFLSEIGKVRESNEDALANFAKELFVVCDGLGGHAAGEVAAKIGVETIIEVWGKSKKDFRERLRETFAVANAAIFQAASLDPQKEGMATTAVAVALQKTRLWVANVGDSRAYLFSGGVLRQITQDHEEPFLGSLTRCLGIDSQVEVDIFEARLKKEDQILLATDGLTDLVSAEETAAILAQNFKNDPQQEMEEKARSLANLALKMGGDDNVTVCLIQI